MAKYASTLIKQAQSWIGCKESDGSHKKIIDVYNSHKPLARGYAVKYTDAWCSTFVSACAIAVGFTDIIPTECGCEKHTELFKKAGTWIEDESITPKPGYIIFYDWDDNGVGDTKGSADHVGIVEKVSGGKITVIEGNYSDSVKRRTLDVNARYIRGYGAPKYDPEGSQETVTPVKPQIARSKTATADPKTVWDYLLGKIGNKYGVAGLMGNLYAESALRPINLQQTYETKLGFTDDSYTDAVDSGSYTNFVKDSAGYGLAQWTYWSRKEALLNYARSVNSSIGNLTTQLEYLWKEIQGYTTVLNTLKSAKTVKEASDIVLTGFERPANQSDAVKVKRAGYGEDYYNKYAGSAPVEPVKPVDPTPIPTTGDQIYTVVKGDTLSKIAKIYGTTYKKLAEYNGIADPNKIYVGQVIKIQGSKPAESSGAPSQSPKWVGKVTASALNVRTWAGTEYPNIKSYPYLHKDNLVDVCDTVKSKSGANWYYVRIAGKYFGFVHSDFIAKA